MASSLSPLQQQQRSRRRISSVNSVVLESLAEEEQQEDHPQPQRQHAGGEFPPAPPLGVVRRDNGGGGGGDCSRSRATLQDAVRSRRGSLTATETSFLHELAAAGSEIEVREAHRKLLDDNLFGTTEEEQRAAQQQQQQQDDGGGGGDGNDAKRYFRRDSSYSLTSVDSNNNSQRNNYNNRPSSFYSLNCAFSSWTTQDSPASAKNVVSMLPQTQTSSHHSIRQVTSDETDETSVISRLEALEQRRKEGGACQMMWRAHESGLQLSQPASRKSLLQKQQQQALSSRRSSLSAVVAGPSTSSSTMRNSAAAAATGSKGDPPLLPLAARRWSLLRNSVLSGTAAAPGRRRASSVSVRDYSGHSITSRMSDNNSAIASKARRRASSLPVREYSEHSITSWNDDNEAIAEVVLSTSLKDEIEEKKGEDESTTAASDDEQQQAVHVSKRKLIAREASINNYNGQGFEIGGDFEIDEDDDESATSFTPDDDPSTDGEGGAAAAFLMNRGNFRSSMRFRDHGLQLLQKPVVMRFDASVTGKGVEICDLVDERPTFEKQSCDELFDDDGLTLHCNTFDETMSFVRVSLHFEQHADRRIHRCLSDDALLKNRGEKMEVSKSFQWHIDSYDHYDSWGVIDDEDMDDYGGALSFSILGTSAHDVDCHPHVLSPPLMESLQPFLPYNKRCESMWLKFSMVRDGASMNTFLQHMRAPDCTFLAIETLDGEVFGSFTVHPWRKNGITFGNGTESFLWRMRGSRAEKCWSVIDQAKKESEIDVFKFHGGDPKVQHCNSDRIVVGGTGKVQPGILTLRDGSPVHDHEWGFGLVIEDDLLRGTSSPCVSFRSPSLSKVHGDGSRFEILNFEAWVLTPCTSQTEAERMDLKKLFLQQHSTEALS